MVWTNDHDVLLCRVILAEQPFQYKTGSREKGHCWMKITKTLNNVTQIRFSVDQRAVRDRFAKLEKKIRKKRAAEERASGISPEQTGLDEAVESILEMSESAQEGFMRGEESRRLNVEKEKETA